MRVRGCAYIEQDEKVLLLAYDYPGGRIYALPGGGIKEGESLAASVAREYVEELGLEVEVGALRFVGDMMAQEGGIKQTVHVVFNGRILSGEPKLNKNETSAAEVLWLDVAELAQVRLYPAIGDALLKDRAEGAASPRYLGNCLAREWA